MMRKLRVFGGLLFFCFLFIETASAFGGNLTVNSSESADIGVTLSQKIEVDITPSSFSWTGLEPGDVGNGSTEASGFGAIQIENIGSMNITHVWFNATYPTTNPFGSGSAADTNAGNYVVLKKEGGSEFYFINRAEYNATHTLVYLTDRGGTMPPDNSQYTYGRFHNASNEYFWMMDAVTGCNSTGTTLYIGNKSHSKTSTGTVNFNLTTDIYEYSFTTHPDDHSWGYADITSGPLTGYCAAVTDDCTKLFFSRWNADLPFNKCSNVNFAWSSASDGDLAPGNSFWMDLQVFIPFGIYEGAQGAGQIVAIVNAE